MDGLRLESISDSKNIHFRSIRGNKDIFHLIYLKNGNELKGDSIIFFQDKVEEISNFKIPLMFIGIGVAFVYQVCFKEGSGRKFKTKKMRDRDLRRERLNQISKQIGNLERTTSSFKTSF